MNFGDRMALGMFVTMIATALLIVVIAIPWMLWETFGAGALWGIGALILFLIISYIVGWFIEWMGW